MQNPGETCRQTAEREFCEEMGVKLDTPDYQYITRVRDHLVLPNKLIAACFGTTHQSS
jgi:NADH pyrophosphatase NudC (nudix superfamily)